MIRKTESHPVEVAVAVVQAAVITKKLRGCLEMIVIRKGGVAQNESHHPKFLHKKRWLTTTIFLRYML